MIINSSAARQSFSFFFFFSFIASLVLQKMGVFTDNGIDGWVVIGGNVVLFNATLISYYISMRSLKSPNPNASVRSLYGSFMVKFFIIAVAAFAYIMAVKKQVNKPALFICMGFYLIYTFLEVTSLQKLLRNKKNAEERSSH